MRLSLGYVPGIVVLGCAGCLSIAGLDGDYRAGAGPEEAGAGSPTTSGTQTGTTSGGGGIAGDGGAGTGATGQGGQGAVGAGGGNTGGGSTGGGSTGASGPGGGAPGVLDTVVVDCTNDDHVHSNITLQAGAAYTLRASGDCRVTPDGTRCDAEWMDFNNPHTYDNSNAIDMGLAVDDTSEDFVKQPDWGSYDPSHVYELPFVGQGATITLQFHDPDNSNNEGSLTLEIIGYP